MSAELEMSSDKRNEGVAIFNKWIISDKVFELLEQTERHTKLRGYKI